MTDTSESPPPPAAPRLPRNVWLLSWTSLLNDTASEMAVPLLPLFLSMLGADSRHLGLIEGCADSTASVLKLFSGSWSDRAGRRKGFIVFGYALPALARPLLKWATSPWHVLAVRVGDRIGKGMRVAPRDALLADSTDHAQRGRAFGLHRAMDHLGAAIGPLAAAGYLYLWPGQLSTLFFLALVPGVLLVLLASFGLKEEPPQHKAARPLDFSLRHYSRDFHIYLLALLVFTLGNSTDLFLLERAQELNVSAPLLPILWFVFHLAKSAGNLIGGGLVDRFGAKPLLIVGWIWYAAIYLAFGWATAAWQIWTLFILYAMYYALTEPSEKTLVAQLAGKQRTGLAYGWYNLLMGVAALPASAGFGIIYKQFGALTAFALGSSLAAAAVALLLPVNAPRREGDSAHDGRL